MKDLWKRGTMVDKAETPRSFWIKTDDGGEYRRNRRMLINSEESPSNSDEPWDDFQSVSQPAARCDTATTTLTLTMPSTTVDTTTNASTNTTSDTISRSGLQSTSRGRIIRKPARFSDYVMD